MPEEVAERDSLVDGEALHLVERGRMRRVGRVASVHPPRADDVDRRLLGFHGADLSRRRLGTEDRLVVEEERLQRRAGRVAWWEVEGVEVVVRRLDLAAVDDRVAEAEEDVLELAPDLRNEVEVAPADRRAGDRDVHALLRQPSVELGALELPLSRIDSRLEPLPQRVERHACLPVAHLPERELQLALAAEILDAHLFDVVDRRGRTDGGESDVLECLGVHGSAEVTNVPAPA